MDFAKLLGCNPSQIFDFQVDETVQRAGISLWELKDGQWDRIYGGGGLAFSDAKGRLALSYDQLELGLRESFQSENNSFSNAIALTREPYAMTSRATSLLSQRQEIVYDQEIPLVVQIVTDQNELRSFDPSYFFHPEDYAKYGYEHVYAVTVSFSQEKPE